MTAIDLRSATRDDAEAIRGVAERSFQASFSLSPEQIEAIIEEEFDAEHLAGRVDDEDCLVFAAEHEGEVAGFADVDLAVGTLRWLHVDPLARGQGVGTALMDRVEAELSQRGKPITAQILDEATEGDSFIERFGLNRTDTTKVEFRNQELSAHVYSKRGEENDPNEPEVAVPANVDVDGAERPLNREEPIGGDESPFFLTYTDEDRSERHGFFCSNCGSIDVSADGMDRIECKDCGNKHLADDWDDAYL
jgi:GNAT superfamily N-acetyltransferase/ribosomal protein S27AE